MKNEKEATPKLAKRKKSRWTRDDTELTLLGLPAAIWFAVFAYLPLFGLIVAFKDYRLQPGMGFLGSLFAGNVSMMLYSTTAGLLSVCACRLMLLLVPRISFVAVSVTGAVLHNLVQLSVYCALAGTAQLFGYAPYLCLLGAVSGAVVGLAVTYTLKSLPVRILPQDRDKGGIK